MDFSKLRAAALKNGDDEEAVTVNTRALIDKVLARYSGEWTTLRELIQNAADAQATTVTIKFETLPSAQIPFPNTTNQSEILKHVLLNHTLKRLVVTNDGQAFGANDWARLKRIAEGNPDETKIGAFGVGFYSVFADCEDPFVSSGKEAMAFYWKGNSLFTKKVQLPVEEANPNTSFVLDYRNTTTPMPNLLSIAQFLATSLTFVALQNMELWVDDWKIISLQKKVAPSIEVPLARDVETRTREGWMTVKGLERESVQMDASFMNVVGWKPKIISKNNNVEVTYGSASEAPSLKSFFSRFTNPNQSTQKSKALKEEKAMQEIILEDLTTLSTANVFLRVTTAQVKTAITTSIAAELERATKKPPPKTTKLSILTSSYDETEASTRENTVAKGVNIFASVLPSQKPGGRIFIGFPTHQTTGAGLHLSAPSVIPTVERESIDLNARWVRTWNIEMLRVAGIMSRLAFSNEMADLSAKIIRAAENAGHGTKVSKEEIATFLPEAMHILRTFTFQESTPAAHVSQIIEEAFWTAHKKASIEMYSSRGVLLTTKVRLATDDLSGFVEGIPVVPKELVDMSFVNKLKDFGLLTEITFGDVKQELEAKALTKDQLIQFIGWIGRKAVTGEMDAATIHTLLDVTIATVEEVEGQGGVIALATIKNFLMTNKIPAEVPVPPTTIPFIFTRASPINELQALGWETLEIVPWLRYLIESSSSKQEEQNLTKAPKFAAQVLLVISKQWDNLSPSSKSTIKDLLSPLTIIPTKFGMKRPAEAFFASVKLFDDLPIVTGCQGIKEKFFAAIGVRKTVDLDTIFSRLLMDDEGAETEKVPARRRNGHVELIKYLASVRDEIPRADIEKLRASKICPAEAGEKGMESTQGTPYLLKVAELYEPTPALRELGLPILQWPGLPGSFHARSPEGIFLFHLGLKSCPTVRDLVPLMASDDLVRRQKAISYFISSHHTNGYATFPIGTLQENFVPLEGTDNRLVSPGECFTNEKCAVLGFNLLKRELQPHAIKFGVKADPPIAACVEKLIQSPPRSRQDAIPLFTYFTGRIGQLSGTYHLQTLSNARIVPVTPRESKETRLLAPSQCYLGSSTTYGDIFDFVDFGSEANPFLTLCGSKSEPTKHEIAALVAREPARLLGVLVTPEKYISVLRTLADDAAALRKDKQLWEQLKASKCLIAWRQIVAQKQVSSLEKPDPVAEDEFEDEAPIKTYELESAKNIIIIDDYAAFRLFKDKLVCAPEEEKLEEFYIRLGSSSLAALVEEDLRVGPPVPNQSSALKLQSQIIERSKLFLHEMPKDTVKNDSKWLEKNFTVLAVSSISVRRTLRGRSLTHKESRTAATSYDRRRGWILYVASHGYDSYQVSQAVCKLILNRQTQQALLSFETLLTLSLVQLRSRGYNVERILRQKAAEQRIAEEQRQKQLEEEQKAIKAQEVDWKNQSQMVPATAREERPKSKDVAMPGAFGSDSPPATPAGPKRSRGLFSGLKDRFSSGEAQQQLQNFLGGGLNHVAEDNPPTYEESAVGKPKTGGAEQVSSPHTVQQNLLNAIQASRAYDSSTLFSPPNQQKVKEQATYCDSTPAQNLSYLADAANGTRVFISKDVAIPPATFLGDNVSALNLFAAMLHEIGDIYNLPRQSLHIFYDTAGGTIAFNSSGSIFCNFRFFNQLHQKKVEADTPQKDGRVEAASYWWIVLAHELAHNIVQPHNAEHSYYTESLVANYFGKMMATAASYQNSTSIPVQRQIAASESAPPIERSLLD